MATVEADISYPEIHKKQIVFIADYNLTKKQKKEVQILVHGKIHEFSTAFTNRTLIDIVMADTQCAGYWINVNNKDSRIWLSKSLIDINKNGIVIIVAKRSIKADFTTPIRAYAHKILKHSDMMMLDEIVDKNSGELVDYLHIKKSPGFWSIIGKAILRMFRSH